MLPAVYVFRKSRVEQKSLVRLSPRRKVIPWLLQEPQLRLFPGKGGQVGTRGTRFETSPLCSQIGQRDPERQVPVSWTFVAAQTFCPQSCLHSLNALTFCHSRRKRVSLEPAVCPLIPCVASPPPGSCVFSSRFMVCLSVNPRNQ